jgi:tetratricopeptide (TPR) repeat protein
LSSLVFFLFFYFACARYQFEFVPALALLAALGILALEGGWSGGIRAAARCAWIPALALSSAFPVLYAIDRSAADHNISGITSLAYGDFPDADREFATARLLSPRNPLSRLGSGMMLSLQGRPGEAQAALEALTRDFPDYALAHFALGNVLAGERRGDEALAEYREAHRLDASDASIAAALDAALSRRK